MGCIAGLASVVLYGMIEPPTDYEGVSQYFRYLIHPTGGAIPASEGGLTNLWPFVSAIIGSATVTVAGSYALPDEVE